MARDVALNLKHADDPLPGDYWHEMFCPTAYVRMVDAKNVLVQKLAGRTEMTANDPKPVVMTKRSFSKWIRYDSIPDKTWADVVPGRFDLA